MDDLEKVKKFYKNKKILVIGSTGFIGSWLSISLINLGAKVYGIGLKPKTKPSLFYSCRLEKKFKKHFFVDIRNKKIFLFFPGNPCSSFVLTNILVNSLILKYQYSKVLHFDYEIDIEKIKFNFKSLVRKSFLFGFMKSDQNIKIFNNQESSNISNIFKSNCLIYFNKTKKLRIYKLNDK